MKVVWNSKYKTISVYTIITALVIVLIILFFLNLGIFGNAVAALFSILLPFVIGFAAAYLLSRPAIFLENKVFAFTELRKPHPALRRGLAIFLLFVIVFGIFVLLIYFIIPQLLESAATLFRNLPSYLDQLEDAVVAGLKNIDLYSMEIQEHIDEFRMSFLDLTSVLNQLTSQLPSLISSVGTGIFNFFVGMIVCVYVLFSRERFTRQGKKLIYAVFKPKFARSFLDMLKYSNNVFLGYIMGTLASTAFIGLATFIFMTVCGMPYAILITVIVAITNVIPFFGPFLGAIPSAVILLIVDPLYALAFVVFIIILQQIDGNIVLPKLIGMNVGLSAFWVLLALLLGGGLFGFWGLVLGVPIFAVIYALVSTLINNSLEKKGVPPEKYIYPKDKVPPTPKSGMNFQEKLDAKRRKKREKQERKSEED